MQRLHGLDPPKPPLGNDPDVGPLRLDAQGIGLGMPRHPEILQRRQRLSRCPAEEQEGAESQSCGVEADPVDILPALSLRSQPSREGGDSYRVQPGRADSPRGFLLLAALPHRSLHRRSGHGPALRAFSIRAHGYSWRPPGRRSRRGRRPRRETTPESGDCRDEYARTRGTAGWYAGAARPPASHRSTEPCSRADGETHPQPWSRIARFSPAFCRTFRPTCRSSIHTSAWLLLMACDALCR